MVPRAIAWRSGLGYIALVRWAARQGLLAAGCLGLAVACIDRAPFACEDDEQCRGADLEGSCVAPGFCAHPDEDCESGQRFGRFASPELAGRCTRPELATGSGSSSSEGSSEGSGEGSSESSSEGSSTQAGESSSSGEPGPQEECNGLDDDGDGLVDEWSPVNEQCDDCMLYQRSGSAYWLCDGGRWTDVQPLCASFGANLASVQDADENLFLVLNGNGDTNWIGLNDIGNEGVFTWVDGAPVEYTNWVDGQAPIDNLDANCVGVDSQGEWHDLNCTNYRAGFCEAPHPD
jgi:hypothetical protein